MAKLHANKFALATGIAGAAFIAMKKFLFRAIFAQLGMICKIKPMAGKAGMAMQQPPMCMGYIAYKIIIMFVLYLIAGWILATVYNMLLDKK